MPVILGPGDLTSPPDAADLPTLGFLGVSGIVLNDVDDYDCKWVWTNSTARGNKPAPREVTGDRPNAHGQWDATRFYGPRVKEITGTVHAPNHKALHYAEQRLRATVGVDPFAFRVTEPGYDTWVMVRQQGDILWNEYTHRLASFSLSLYAADPLWRSVSRESDEIGFPSTSGGLVWPATWPAIWNATTVDGSVVLTNQGTEPAPLQIHGVGPFDDLTISNPDTTEVLTIVNPNGATLSAGQWLDIDTGLHKVTLLDTGNRRSWARGDWIVLPPQKDTTLQIASSNAGVGASVTFEHYDYWM